jgi:hypothetical protein
MRVLSLKKLALMSVSWPRQAQCIDSWLDKNATCPTCRKGAVAYPFLARMGEARGDMAVQCEGLVAMCKTAGVEGPPPNENQNSQRSVLEADTGVELSM